MTIKSSCNTTKFCGKCGKEIWSFERRKNCDSGNVTHLKGQCPNVMDRPPGSDNPVVGKDSMQLDNRKWLNLIYSMLLIISVLILSGCGCSVDVGDNVRHMTGSVKGEVIHIYDGGQWTDQCKIKVYDKSNNSVDGWFYAFEFKVVK